MKPKRLFWQLNVSYLAITVFSLAAALMIAGLAYKAFYYSRVKDGLESRAHLVEQQFVDMLQTGQAPDSLCKQLGRSSNTRITVILPDGKVVGDSEQSPLHMDNHADRPEFKAAVQGRVGSEVRRSFTLGQDMLYVAIPVSEQDKVIAVVRMSVPLASLGQA